ncbi:alpha/beta hydrolase [Lysobacter cavernae]|uniref:Alpha/beta hydrolase n=1 Tax=Lysobacter cavernae TaxID=1685901 RepID=A0ABV7RQR1_9GAMM
MHKLALVVLLLFAGAAGADTPSADTAAEAASRLYLWPDEIAPGSQRVALAQQIVERSHNPALPDRIVTGVTRPHLVVYRPAKPNGAALLVIPGGGYRRIVLDKEGSALAPVFADQLGYTLFVLRYRLPGEGHDDARDAPLADAQRALRLIRARAHEWRLDPQRIGAIGFSAGGHVAASLGTRFDERLRAPVDARDGISARPDFVLLMYPVIDMGVHAHAISHERLLGAAPTPAQIAAYSLQNRVGATTPPTFLLHASDDTSVAVDNSLLFYDALRRAHVPAQLHLYPHGGHGFGVRDIAGSPLALWPQMADAWIRSVTEKTP